MSIKVTYENLQIDNDYIDAKVTESLVRDISWGTYTEDLKSIAKKHPNYIEKVKLYEPKIEPRFNAVTEGKFALTFKDEMFDLDSEGIDHFIATIAGDVLAYRGIKKIQVKDFEFDEQIYSNFFSGPKYGIAELYNNFFKKTLKGVERPILAFSVKPRLGLNENEYGLIYEMAAKGGVDLIEDDERLIDPIYCRFESRAKVMASIQSKYNSKFSINITGPIDKMKNRIDFVAALGLNFVKVDVLVTGFDSLREVSRYIQEKTYDIAITCYPDISNSYRNLSKEFIIKMARLCGADIIYTSTPNWSRVGTDFDETEYYKNLQNIERKLESHKILLEPIGSSSIKTSLPTISNGCNISHAELIQSVYKKIFNISDKYAFFVGGGISDYPKGDIERAIKEWIACMEYTAKKDLNDYKNYNYSDREALEDNNIRLFNLEKELKI